MNPDENIDVAVVTGSTVRVFGRMGQGYNPVRPYLRPPFFKHYGAAKLWADEFEDAQRQTRRMRPA